jgi:protein TonB
LNVHSGLSGACVQSKKWQRCDDSETDPRVNAEVCRGLGVRSILVLPVVRKDELLGVFEVFSPRPNAFTDREIQTLQALSRSIVNNVDRAADALTSPAQAYPSSSAAAVNSAIAAEVQSDDLLNFDSPPLDSASVEATHLDHSQPDASLPSLESLLETATSKIPNRDPWMGVLTLAVIAAALFLGWMAGYVRSPRASLGPKTKTANPQLAQVKPPAAAASIPGAGVRPPDQPTSANPTTPPRPSQPTGSAAPPVGGLVVYEKGKVIFQTSPTSRPAANDNTSEPVTVPSKVADEYVLQRVEPEYPEPAREQHVQGPVVLEALVGKDGAVEKLSTISGDPQLAAAATDAVRQWRFKPFFRSGSPEEFQTQITLNFRLP